MVIKDQVVDHLRSNILIIVT